MSFGVLAKGIGFGQRGVFYAQKIDFNNEKHIENTLETFINPFMALNLSKKKF